MIANKRRFVTCLNICSIYGALTALLVCVFVETSGELMQTQPIKGHRVTGAKSS